ncbi:MAG: phage tail protein, partial [Sphingobacteriales bacterium]
NNYIGEIKMFAGNFAPSGWAMCNGQLLSIAQNQALFSILGTTYGGNGVTTFALPDMRGRVPMHQGSATGVSGATLGEYLGTETVTLISSNIPAHSHTLNIYNGAGDLDSLTTSGTASLALPLNADLSRAAGFSTFAPNMVLNANTVSPVFSANTPIQNRQPSLAVTFIIALTGIFPTQ